MKKTTLNNSLLTAKDVAQMAKVSPKTVSRWRRDGQGVPGRRTLHQFHPVTRLDHIRQPDPAGATAVGPLWTPRRPGRTLDAPILSSYRCGHFVGGSAVLRKKEVLGSNGRSERPTVGWGL